MRPVPLAGQPVVVGESLLLPIADGFVYRHIPGVSPNPDTLVAGPLWASGRHSGEVACYITPLSATAFLTSDGGKRLIKWDWPLNGRWNPTGNSWDLRERSAGPGVTLPPSASGGSPRFLVADITGSIWMFAADRSGPYLRRWKPGGGIPVGQPSSPLVLQADAGGRQLVAYTVANRLLVCLDPDRDQPLWATRPAEDAEASFVGAPQATGDGRWIATDLQGRVTLFDGVSGKVAATLEIRLPGAVPAVASGLLGAGAILSSLSDGSAVVLPLSAPPAAKP